MTDMILEFTKMNGAGNDFVLVDNRDRKLLLTPRQIQRLCDRQRGVGADGLILLVPSRQGQADWAWDFFNSDGSTAEMCGNGARCFARFTQRITGNDGPFSFETGAGIIGVEFEGEQVTVDLTPPAEARFDQSVTLSAGTQIIHSINTGVPHAVLFVEDADQAMVGVVGAEVRFHEHFAPRGTNVNFVQKLADLSIRVRTYERGVEGETLACGTGVAASALVSARAFGWASPVRVRVQGGEDLEVHFSRHEETFSQVRLKGPADFVFEGRIKF